MKKLFILLIKYMPIIQMVGMLFNNTLYYAYDTYTASYIIDFLIGNSVITTLLLFVCSYTFGFCKYYRIIILANFINVLIASLDASVVLPISDIKLLLTYYIIASIFIIVATYSHVKNNKNAKQQTNCFKEYSCRKHK